MYLINYIFDFSPIIILTVWYHLITFNFTVQELRDLKKSLNVEKEPRMVIENSPIEVRIFSLVVKLFVNHHVLSAHIMVH